MDVLKASISPDSTDKELKTENKTTVIIAAEVLERKKQTKLTYKEINIIHRVASYEYKEIK